ncbi:MAG: hypothetical protein ACM3WT_03480 [Bacillota bacterium]
MARVNFRAARDYVVYYGCGRVNEIASFDVAILESSAHAAGEVADIIRRGCLPISYLSIIESGEHLPYHSLADAEDFLWVGGSRVMVPEFNTWVMDVRRPHWRDILLSAADDMLRKGFVGLFLDTVGWAEDPSLPRSLSFDLTESAQRLIKGLRTAHPEAVLIQNLGLRRLIQYTAPLLDGVCWEGFGDLPGRDPGDLRRVIDGLSMLRRLNDRHGLRVLLLAHSDLPVEIASVLERDRSGCFMLYKGLAYSRTIEQNRGIQRENRLSCPR